MPLSTNKPNVFLKQVGQLILSRRVKYQYDQEGLIEINDFLDFKEDQVTQAFCNIQT